MGLLQMIHDVFGSFKGTLATFGAMKVLTVNLHFMIEPLMASGEQWCGAILEGANVGLKVSKNMAPKYILEHGRTQ